LASIGTWPFVWQLERLPGKDGFCLNLIVHFGGAMEMENKKSKESAACT